MRAEVKPRSIRPPFDISPATEKTCGDGSGRFCYLMQLNGLSGVAKCYLFGDLLDLNGWVQRSDECIAAEGETSTP